MATPTYELIESDTGFHDEHWVVSILDGDLSGVKYQYDTISANEIDDALELKFNTITVENPEDKDLTAKESIDIMGDILVELLNESIEERLKHESQSGTGDTEAPSQ
jgi:hypothetical protein